MGRFKQLQNLFKGDRIIWIIFFLLCIISVLEVYSSSSFLGYKSGNYWWAALYHTILLGIGFLAMVCVLNVPCRYFKVMTPIMVPFSLLLLILVLFFGSKENDAARWIKLFGFIPLQPSEIAKGTMVLATAHILSQLQTPTGAHPKAFKFVLCTAGALILLVLPENFSTAALMGFVTFLMMIIGRVPLRQLGYLCSAIAILAVVAVMLIWAVGKSSSELAQQQPQDTKPTTEVVDGRQTTDEIQPVTADAEVKPVKRGGILHRLDLWKQRIDDFMNKET